MEGITFALTSCGRLDLLERTIDSFLKFNTSVIRQYIISEDDCSTDLTYLKEKYKHLKFIWLQNQSQFKRGMLGNIDYLYNHIKTEWVFHCEDDWEFYRKGFIEASMAILGPNPKLLQVWLREQNDTNGHPIEEHIFSEERIQPIQYRLAALNYMGCFSGYSTNPGLRRLRDKVCFQALNELGPANIGPEGKVSIYYELAGFRTAILMQGYVRHIGQGRSTL